MRNETNFLEGVTIGFVPDSELRAAVKKYLVATVEDAGGRLVEWNTGTRGVCTYLVTAEPLPEQTEWGRGRGNTLVTLLWLWDCVQSRRLLPHASEPLYNAQARTPRPSQSNLNVSMTGYQDFSKVVYARMLARLGLTFHKSMDLQKTDYLIAGDLADQTSLKIQAVRSASRKIHVVNILWVYDSLRQGSLLPADAYKFNPPANMDPYRGALAMDACVQVVANSDSDNPTPPVTEAKGARDMQTLRQGDANTAIATASKGLEAEHQPGKMPSTGRKHLQEAKRGRSSINRRLSGNECRLINSRAGSGASLLRAGAAGEEDEAVGMDVDDCSHQQGGAAPHSKEVLPKSACKPTTRMSLDSRAAAAHSSRQSPQGSLGSYMDMSQQVACAEKAVSMLVAQLVPIEASKSPSCEKAAVGGNENKRPEDCGAELPVSEEKLGAGSTGGCYPFWNASGDKKKVKETSKVLEEGLKRPERKRLLIPVNAEATLASQPLDDGAVSKEALVSGRSTDKRSGGQDGVLWKAAPLKRSELARNTGLKRKGHTDGAHHLVGRAVLKEFEEGAFKGRVESFNAGTEYFRVKYEDDDSEDLSLSELQLILVTEEPSGQPSASGEERITAAEDPCGSDERAKRKRLDGCEKNPSTGNDGHGDEADAPLPRARPRKRNAPKRQDQMDEPTNASPPKTKKATRARLPGAQKETPQNRQRSSNEAENTCCPSVKRSLQKNKRPVVTVSGMHTGDREQAAAILKSLGIGFSANLLSHRWDLRCTHLVLDVGWKRGAKVLSAMAAGAWLLSDRYLEACNAARSLVEEDGFEVSGKKKGMITEGAPKHWRLRRKLLDQPAFCGLKAVVYGDFDADQKPGKEEVASILQAGGADVLTVKQALNVGAHFVVTKPSRSASDPKVKQLMNAGLCLVSPLFVLDWVAHPRKPLTKHLLFGTRMGSELTKTSKERGVLPTDAAQMEQTPLRNQCTPHPQPDEEMSQLY